MHGDLVNLISQPAKPKEELKEDLVDDVIEKSERMTKSYNELTTGTLSKVMSRLQSGADITYQEMKTEVDAALESLKTVLNIFPSLKTFEGEYDNFAEVSEKFNIAVKQLDFDISNIQTIKVVAIGTIENLADGLSEFSSEVEKIFGIETKIKSGEISTDASTKEEWPSGWKPDQPPKEITTIGQFERFIQLYALRDAGIKKHVDSIVGEDKNRKDLLKKFLIHYLFLKTADPAMIKEVSKTDLAKLGDIDLNHLNKYYTFISKDAELINFLDSLEKSRLKLLLDSVENYLQSTPLTIAPGISFRKLTTGKEEDDPQSPEEEEEETEGRSISSPQELVDVLWSKDRVSRIREIVKHFQTFYKDYTYSTGQTVPRSFSGTAAGKDEIDFQIVGADITFYSEKPSVFEVTLRTYETQDGPIKPRGYELSSSGSDVLVDLENTPNILNFVKKVKYKGRPLEVYLSGKSMPGIMSKAKGAWRKFKGPSGIDEHLINLLTPIIKNELKKVNG